MHRQVLLAAAAGTFLLHSAQAAPVDSSLRPQSRPGTGFAETNVVSVDSPVRSLRPEIRPATLSSKSEASPVRISTSNQAFDRWIAGFRGRALSAGIDRGVFDRAFRGIRFNTDVIQKDRNQAEFKRYIWDYLDSAASPDRVNEGRKALRRHGRALGLIEKRFGVEKEVVAAIWGLESRYGTRKGDIPVIEALATLAFDGRRGSFFEKQLVAALKILQSGDVGSSSFTGSWAGAMGHTQFIPTSYLAYAVDFTGDGRRDIWSDDPTDALASTAAYLARFGWKKGQPWGVEVRLPGGFNAAGARRMPSDWAARGVVGTDGRPVPDYGPAEILQPAGPRGAAFMIFHNFDVIRRYNNAEAYVIGVGHLADRIAGGPPIQAAWPRGYKPLTFDQRKEMQRRLRRKGYSLEKIDGIVGPNTVSAIRSYQKSIGVEPDGYPSQTLLQQLRGG